MNNSFSIKDYHKSINEELIILKNRVRNLVKHHGEDGRYKEAVLKNIIRKYLPQHYLIGTGFIVKSESIMEEHKATKQIDLIIYDSSKPVLFSEGDFVILTPESVLGIIEVKTNLKNQNFAQVLKTMNENGAFIYDYLTDNKFGKRIFNGIFSYEGYCNLNPETIKKKIVAGYKNLKKFNMIPEIDIKNYVVNHISLNERYFIKTWPDDENINFSIYNIPKLSFSYFIYNLIFTIIEPEFEMRQESWFPENKEINKIFEFSIQYKKMVK